MTEHATVGAICRPQVSPEQMLRTAIEADRAGLAELWLWEDCFLEGGLTSAAAILAATEGLHVGIGLLPMPLRNVAITAMEIATLERMFPGRLRVAVGHGVQDWMGQVGARVRSPLGLAREYIGALRRLLDGERVTVAGEYVNLDDVALGWPPNGTVPILLGAIGPKSIALAGELADGVLLDAGFTVEGARGAVDACRAAHQAAGRTDAFEVAIYERYYRGVDAASQLAGEARPEGLPANATPAEAADRVWEFSEAGVQTVVFMPSATEPDPADFLSTIAAHVSMSA